MHRTPLLIGALLASVWPHPAQAQGPVDVSANVGLVSDYRYRGLSLSGGDPALQGGIDVETDMGLFAGTWASTIADYGGARVEVDLSVGYGGKAAGFDYALSGNAYLYPGGNAVNFVEFRLDITRALGSATLAAELSYAPSQRNTGTANRYVGGSAALAVPGVAGLAANLRGGREQGFYESKWDWEVGAAYTRGGVTGSFAYVNSNHGAADEAGRLGRAGVVASLLSSF